MKAQAAPGGSSAPMRHLVLALACLVLAGCATPTPDPDGTAPTTPDAGAPAQTTAFGTSRIVATAPGGAFIEGIAYRAGIAAATTAFGAGSETVPINNPNVPSRIFLWNVTTGELVDTIDLEGEDTMSPHGLVGITYDAQGRIYALSSQLGLVRWTGSTGSWTQEVLATFPDLPPCLIAAAPCSPTLRDEPAIGNDLTFGPDGALYVSDSFQATVWKVAPGGEVTLWFQHESLDRKFGPNGLRVAPDGRTMTLAVTGPDAATLPAVVDRGSKIFSIPFPDPGAGTLETLWSLPNGDLADGIGYGARGDLYVLSNAGDRLFILPAGGGEPRVVDNADLTGEGAMDFPASLAFDGAGNILVANYAYAKRAFPERHTVLAIFVDDVGPPPTTAPGL